MCSWAASSVSRPSAEMMRVADLYMHGQALTFEDARWTGPEVLSRATELLDKPGLAGRPACTCCTLAESSPEPACDAAQRASKRRWPPAQAPGLQSWPSAAMQHLSSWPGSSRRASSPRCCSELAGEAQGGSKLTLRWSPAGAHPSGQGAAARLRCVLRPAASWVRQLYGNPGVQ